MVFIAPALPITAATPAGAVDTSVSGLVRVTGVAVDQAGNVWLANNWKEIPLQTNPGGYEIVAYVGLAAPVDIPAPIVRPSSPTAPAATPRGRQPDLHRLGLVAERTPSTTM